MTKNHTEPPLEDLGPQPPLTPFAGSTQTATGDTSQSLSALPLGESRTIDHVSGDAPELKRRLYALGFVPGARITKLRVAPFGDPIQVRVGGSSVSMRRREASMIHLQSSPHSHD